MYEKFRALIGFKPVDPLAHYYDEARLPGPFDGLSGSERKAHEIAHSLLSVPVRQIFVVTGANGLSAQIAEANGDPEPPRDGWLGGLRLLIELTEATGNHFVDWAATQPGLVVFDQWNGRLRRAVIDLSHYLSPEKV